MRRAARWALLPVGALVWLGLLAGPAAADAARPGDVRSQVTGLTPSSAGIHAEVLGGDSFLHLRVDPGTQVVVIGYQDEPYLRVGADGTVQVNDRSPARWLNEKRLADVPVPPSADPTAPPAWRTIGHGGSVSWHDHRTHWMATTKPDPPVREWSVPLRVDDRAVTIDGRYAFVTPPPIWLWWGVAAAIAMLTTVVAWSRVGWAGAVVGPTGVLAVVVGWALWRVPGGNSAGATAMVLGAIAVAGAVAGWWGRRGTYAGVFVAASGAALVAYALPRITVFEHAVLITQLPATLDRLSVAAAVGAGGAALALGFRAVANPMPRSGRPGRAGSARRIPAVGHEGVGLGRTPGTPRRRGTPSPCSSSAGCTIRHVRSTTSSRAKRRGLPCRASPSSRSYASKRSPRAAAKSTVRFTSSLSICWPGVLACRVNVTPSPWPSRKRTRLRCGPSAPGLVEQEAGWVVELDHRLGGGPGEGLPGPHVEGHARPPPRVDVQAGGHERLGRGARRDARLVEVAEVLAPHDVVAAEALGRREHLALLVLQEVGLGTDGRLHRQQGHHLQQVVLHHVAQRADRVVEAARGPRRRSSRPW